MSAFRATYQKQPITNSVWRKFIIEYEILSQIGSHKEIR